MPTLTARQRKLIDLAERIEKGAAELRREAVNALNEQGQANPDPAQRSADKNSAAAAAEDYAKRLRNDVARGVNPTKERLAEAAHVAQAAELGGILIDGRRLAENTNYWSDEARDTAVRDAIDRVAEIQQSGAFEYVAEPGQVAFWRLRKGAKQLQPLLHRSRYTDEEWERSVRGECGYMTANYPALEWCTRPSDPKSYYRHCKRHDRQVRDESPGAYGRAAEARSPYYRDPGDGGPLVPVNPNEGGDMAPVSTATRGRVSTLEGLLAEVVAMASQATTSKDNARAYLKRTNDDAVLYEGLHNAAATMNFPPPVLRALKKLVDRIPQRLQAANADIAAADRDHATLQELERLVRAHLAAKAAAAEAGGTANRAAYSS